MLFLPKKIRYQMLKEKNFIVFCLDKCALQYVVRNDDLQVPHSPSSLTLWKCFLCFQVVIPWCSPVGLRALFCMDPFMPDLELSQVNGTLFPRKSSLTPTLCSRLLALWRHISKSRTHFETKPDTGKDIYFLCDVGNV